MEYDKLNPILPDGVNRDEVDALESTWRALGAIEAPAPASDRMRARLDAVIDTFEDATAAAQIVPFARRRLVTYAIQALAAAAVLVIGIAIGRSGGPDQARPADGPDKARPAAGSPPAASTDAAQIAAMRSEVHDLREMVSLSLMQQQSASARIKGVSWTGRIDQPSDEIVASLLDTLMHDPNVNVRLATIDALERYASRADVRQGAIEAVGSQASPLVQIALIDFMVETNERAGVPALRRLAMDPRADSTVRARAQWGLQQLG